MPDTPAVIAIAFLSLLALGAIALSVRASRMRRSLDDTPTSPADPLIASWDYGTTFSLASGETFTADFGASIFSFA